MTKKLYEAKIRLQEDKEESFREYAQTYLELVTGDHPPTKDDLKNLDQKVERMNGVNAKIELLKQRKA